MSATVPIQNVAALLLSKQILELEEKEDMLKNPEDDLYNELIEKKMRAAKELMKKKSLVGQELIQNEGVVVKKGAKKNKSVMKKMFEMNSMIEDDLIEQNVSRHVVRSVAEELMDQEETKDALEEEYMYEPVACSNKPLSLFDINWSDVLIPSVAVHLSLKDLFNLRCCSRLAKRFAEASLEMIKEINLAGNNSRNVQYSFAVIAKCCRRLETMQLARCFWLKDELMLPILANNTRLRVVNLNECMNITPLAFQPIIIDCKDLRVLKLSRCQWLTTGAVDALTLHQSNLVEFDISHCRTIGERCLIIFFRKLNKLTVLSLAYTPSVTDQVLIQIANYCRSLEHINLVGCTAISDYGILALSTHCTNLRSLLIQRCPHVTERILAPLRKRIYIDRPRASNIYTSYG